MMDDTLKEVHTHETLRNDVSIKKVSIVTVCYNAEKTISRTIESVIHQTYPDIEYIIIDGASTDGTATILERYEQYIHTLVSERDEGISDAFNKGINIATGEYIQILNADDFLPPDKVSSSVSLLDKHPEAGFVHGNIILIDDSGRPIMKVEGDPNYARSVKRRMPRINHPTLLVRQVVYQDHGHFDNQWKIAMDYEWLLRVAKAGITGVYSPDILVYMQAGGTSVQSVRKSIDEERRIAIYHGANPWLIGMLMSLRIFKHNLRLLLEKIIPPRILAYFRPGKTLYTEP